MHIVLYLIKLYDRTETISQFSIPIGTTLNNFYCLLFFICELKL